MLKVRQKTGGGAKVWSKAVWFWFLDALPQCFICFSVLPHLHHLKNVLIEEVKVACTLSNKYLLSNHCVLDSVLITCDTSMYKPDIDFCLHEAYIVGKEEKIQVL